MPVINALNSTISEYRSDQQFDTYIEKAQELIPESLKSSSAGLRTRRRPTHLEDYSVEESIGERSNEYDELKSCFFEVIDVILAEFDARFTENNWAYNFHLNTS